MLDCIDLSWSTKKWKVLTCFFYSLVSSLFTNFTNVCIRDMPMSQSRDLREWVSEWVNKRKGLNNTHTFIKRTRERFCVLKYFLFLLSCCCLSKHIFSNQTNEWANEQETNERLLSVYVYQSHCTVYVCVILRLFFLRPPPPDIWTVLSHGFSLVLMLLLDNVVYLLMLCVCFKILSYRHFFGWKILYVSFV